MQRVNMKRRKSLRWVSERCIPAARIIGSQDGVVRVRSKVRSFAAARDIGRSPCEIAMNLQSFGLTEHFHSVALSTASKLLVTCGKTLVAN